MVSSEVTSWPSVCCSVCADVVDVVGGPAEHLAARLLVEVRQRQPGQLRLDLLAQPVHGALDDRGGQPAPGTSIEQPRRQRRSPAPSSSTLPTASKSMPWPGREVDARRACRRGCPRRVPRSRCDRLGLGGRRPGSCRPTTPAKIRSVAWPRIFGPSTDERDAERRRSSSIATTSGALGPQHARSSRLPEPLKSMRLLGRPAAHERIGPAAARRPAGRARQAAHAASCSVSWESTISR